MTLEDKICQAMERIYAALDAFRAPVVLWSSGKDSMVLLHLVRQASRWNVPCITFQEPWQRERLEFTQLIAAEWGLTVYDFPPSELALNRGKGRIDIMQRFQLGNLPLWLARGTEPPLEGQPWQCGLDWMQRPKGGMECPWDVAFVGHKTTDEDPCSGPVPLEGGAVLNPAGISLVYPLEHWTDADIFTYARTHSIPMDVHRYGDAEVLVNDKSRNPDYYRACTACMDPDNGPVVECPKLRCKIPSMVEHVNWLKGEIPFINWRANVEQ
jgi:hypothetical protein